MPRLTGFEACRRLKADPRTELVPIVLVTGLLAREDRIQGIAAGCDDFLTKPVDSEQLVARTRTLLRTKALVDELEQAENVLVSLATALDAKDNYTSGHSQRVGSYAEELGAAMGLAGKERRNLRRAGLLHDIGKIGTDLAYLNKPGALTTAEYEEVKRHPVIGYEICRPLRTMAPLLALIRGHHERLDGRGYPDGLKAGPDPGGPALPHRRRRVRRADLRPLVPQGDDDGRRARPDAQAKPRWGCGTSASWTPSPRSSPRADQRRPVQDVPDPPEQRVGGERLLDQLVVGAQGAVRAGPGRDSRTCRGSGSADGWRG